ncbi:MAG: outer membrane lipoprotein chaperone LolA [Myxococcota bacterium]
MAAPWMFWGLLATTPPAVAQSAPDSPALDAATKSLVERIQKTYAKVDTLSASFVQVTESGIYGREEQSGELVMQRPNRMRWDFAVSGKQYVLDGSTLWVYQPAQKNVLRFRSIQEQSMVANNLLMSLHTVGEDFDATALPADEGHRLQLLPKDPTLRANVKQIVLSLDTSLVLSGLRLVDPSDNVTDLTFAKTRLGPSIPEGSFTFTVPEGVEIIDAG